MFPNNFLGVDPQAARTMGAEGDECGGPEASLEPDGENAGDPEAELLEIAFDLVRAGGSTGFLRRLSGCDDVGEESGNGRESAGRRELVQRQRVCDDSGFGRETGQGQLCQADDGAEPYEYEDPHVTCPSSR